MSIHNTAVVDESARVGPGVKIGPYAVIESDVELGEGCVIGPHAVIKRFTRLGAQCRVHAGAVLGDEPQEIAFAGVRSYLEIGERCVLREGVTIHRGTEENSKTVVGRECFLMVNSHVGHNSRLGDRVIMANGVLLGGRVEIGNGVFLSGNAVVHQFVRIGSLAMLSGVSGVSKDVPPFCTIHGATINKIAGLNTVGMRRAGMGQEERLEVKRVFKTICASDLNVQQALRELEGRQFGAAASSFIDFVRSSQRGICRMNARD